VTNEPFKPKRRNHRFASAVSRQAWHRGKLKAKLAEITRLDAMVAGLLAQKIKLQEQVMAMGAVPVA
jgi:hypothetical protein